MFTKLFYSLFDLICFEKAKYLLNVEYLLTTKKVFLQISLKKFKSLNERQFNNMNQVSRCPELNGCQKLPESCKMSI